jgi:hypothetical protein
MYTQENDLDIVAIPAGILTELNVGAPQSSVWEGRKRPWVSIDGVIVHRYD